MTKISYVSDLHLEFPNHRPSFMNDEGGDVLILAGDITTAAMLRPNRTDKEARSHVKYLGEKFKRQLIDKYTYVLYVMGNHEHYGYMFNDTKQGLLDGFARLGMEKIKILDNDVFTVNGVAFIGTTLWSDFENGNPQSMLICQRGMNDFRIIGKELWTGKYGSTEMIPITPSFILGEFERSKKFIEMMATEEMVGDKKVVVVTHHGPTNISLNDMHVGNGMDGAYCSNLTNLIYDRPKIKYWIHGHTHQNFDYIVGDTDCRVLACQQGYDFERSYIDFDGTRSFEL